MARIVFMGTPAFAVPLLAALTHTPHPLVGVYTRADKPAGRGKQSQASPVKQFAEENGLAIFQPPTLRQPEFVAPLRDLAPDLIVVAAYGLILPPTALAIPGCGCVNAHASLLPRHRGASPVAAAILAGDAATGITLMQMDAGVDTGAILAQRAIPIPEDDTTGSLTTQLAELAATVLLENLEPILAGTLAPRAQDHSRATFAPLLAKAEGRIDWTRPANEIARRVRAFQPWPSAFTTWNGTPLKILRARATHASADAEPGRIVQNGSAIGVTTGAGILALEEIQLAGKRAMRAEEFARGQRGFVGSWMVEELESLVVE